MWQLFGKWKKEIFYIHLEPKGQNDFGYLYQAFNHMTEELQSSIDKIYNQKMLIQKMELKAAAGTDKSAFFI